MHIIATLTNTLVRLLRGREKVALLLFSIEGALYFSDIILVVLFYLVLSFDCLFHFLNSHVQLYMFILSIIF